MNDAWSGRLCDESGFVGSCGSFSVPESEEALRDVAMSFWEKGIPVTVQGALTGLSGCGVPLSGHAMSVEKLGGIMGYTCGEAGCTVTVQPGVRLSDLARFCAVNSRELKNSVFLPDPTESTAMFGGLFSCDAGGMNSYRHGDTASAVSRVRMLCPNGRFLDVRRGACIFGERGCAIPGMGRMETGILPPKQNGAKGPVSAHEGADLIDILAGGEGMLGIVTELDVDLKARAPERWGILFFFSDDADALRFAAEAVKNDRAGKEDAALAAAEYFDGATLKMVEDYKNKITRLDRLPDFPRSANCAVYMELEAETEQAATNTLLSLLDGFAENNGREDETWAGTGGREIEKFHLLRHAIQEALNVRAATGEPHHPSGIRLCADFWAPFERLCETAALYHEIIEKSRVPGMVFGHAGCNHLSVSLLPRSGEAFEAGLRGLEEAAAAVTRIGGAVLPENGVGKLKRNLFLKYAASERIEAARRIKSFFDPKGLLNPGNML